LWFRIDFHSSKPIYEQIKERIKLLILSGKLKEGEFVPSIRSLAEDLGVNLNTVARAYRELVQEGVLEVRRGEGYIVSKSGRGKDSNAARDGTQEEDRRLQESRYPTGEDPESGRRNLQR